MKFFRNPPFKHQTKTSSIDDDDDNDDDEEELLKAKWRRQV